MAPRSSFITLIFISIILLPGNGTSGNDFSVFQRVVRHYSRIRTIDSEIVQNVSSSGETAEVFKGRYRADSRGRFRIDYYYPGKQIVLNNDRGLFWYYVAENILYEIGKNGIGNAPKFNPLDEYDKRIEGRFRLKYLGSRLYDLHGRSKLYRLTDLEKGLYINLWIDHKRNVLLKKVVSDKNNRELVREVYSDYVKTGDIYFPARLDVMVRTIRGVTRNTTRYRNVILNKRFNASIFSMNFPASAEKRKLNEN